MHPTVLILPGIGDSGPGHWQTLWENPRDNFTRVQQRDWNRPVRSEWVERLEDAVTRTAGDVVLVAHSLGCLLAPHWVAQTKHRIKGALLVAPPDPDGPAYPDSAVGFEHPPL
ncbi:RBBP9/YdeN family alpha/beta hydrolase, partial [Acidihalobacter prosperus]